MPYDEFLEERRRLMADVVSEAYERLVQGAPEEEAPSWPPSPAAVEHLLHGGETNNVELKSSLRADTLDRGIPPKVLEKVVARTAAAFLNAQGGLLIIGVDDDGNPLGLQRDFATLGKRQDLDGFQQALVTVLSSYLGTDVAASVRIHITKVGPSGHDVVLVDCPAYRKPVFLVDGEAKEFHVRAGNTTRLMDVEEATSYIAERWKGLG
jgi:predicted HTH transcriptional regulator